MYKWVANSHIPKWLKILIYIVVTLTLVYWLGLLVYKFFEALRKFLHWATDKHNWWTFLMCIFILLLGSLLIAQFLLGLDPIGKAAEFIVDKWNNLRDTIGNIIST